MLKQQNPLLGKPGNWSTIHYCYLSRVLVPHHREKGTTSACCDRTLTNTTLSLCSISTTSTNKISTTVLPGNLQKRSRGNRRLWVMCSKEATHPQLSFPSQKGGLPYNQLLNAKISYQPLCCANSVAICTAKPAIIMQPLPDEMAAEISTIWDLSGDNEESLRSHVRS